MYAANHAGGIDVFDQSFAAATLTGNFTDPTLPSGLTPFNIVNIGGQLYVTYAQAGPDADEADLGIGIVDVLNTNGTFASRFVTGSVANNVVSPWGVTVAPDGFAGLGGDILVGNFSDENGFINIFDPSGNYLGMLKQFDRSAAIRRCQSYSSRPIRIGSSENYRMLWSWGSPSPMRNFGGPFRWLRKQRACSGERPVSVTTPLSCSASN